jgi:hypothetical protein
MIAQFITWNGETIALCLAQPNLASKLEITATLPTDVAWHPIAKDESRRVFAGASRYQQKYKTTLRTAADCTEFRLWLNRLKDELVAVPVWSDRCTLATDAAAGVGTMLLADHPARAGQYWIVTNSDFSAYEILQVTSISSGPPHFVLLTGNTTLAWSVADGAAMFPLMFGRLTERPELTSSTPERASCDLTFKENSVFARRLNPYASTITPVGSNIANLSTLPLWDIEPNWTRVLDRTEVQIIYELLAFGRVETARVYDQPVARGLEFDIYARDRDAIARAETYFFDRRGTTRPLMVPTFRDDLRLTSDLPFPSDPTVIPIEPSEFVDPARPQQAGDIYFALVDDNGVDPHKFSSALTTTTLTTGVAVSVPHSISDTRVSHLLLARFAESKLAWQYHSEAKASCRVKFIEQPHNYATGRGIVLKEPVFLFRFTKQLPTPQISRFTSYENQFTSGTEVFTPGDFSWRDIEASLDLGDKAEIESSPFPGNPLAEFFPFVIEGLLSVDILEADAANPTAAPVNLFSGEVSEFDPKDFRATCDLGRIFDDVKFPAFYLSTMDNLGIFEGPQAQSLAAWVVAGTISGSPLNTTTIVVASSAANAKPIDYFGMGWIEVAGTVPAKFERRLIIKSTPVAGGVQLVLDRPLLKSSAGLAVSLYPGYDGDIETRASRFNDRAGFGGHPYAPDTPPNIKVLKAKETPGGKKSG